MSCYLFFHEKTAHPSFLTVVPIVGVAFIIAFSSADDLVGKVLGSKPFVALGLISYSAYLWHFPIMAFGRIGDSTPSNYDKFEWIVLTLFLSVFSFWLIEKPFRKQEKIKRKEFLLIMLCLFLFLLVGCITVIKAEGLSWRFPKTGVSLVNELVSPTKLEERHRYVWALKRSVENKWASDDEEKFRS